MTGIPVETASVPAVVPIKPPSLAPSGELTSKPVPTNPIKPKSVVFGVRKPRAYFAAISKPPPTFTTAPMRPEKRAEAFAVVGKQRTPADDRRICRARLVGGDVIAEGGADAQSIRNSCKHILGKEPVGKIARAIGNARTRIDYRPGDGIRGKCRRRDLVAINVCAQQNCVAFAELLVDEEVETKNSGALALISYRGERITVPALIDSFLALTVVGKSERCIIEEAKILLEQTRVKLVRNQVSQVRDQVAVAAQQLIVTPAAILLIAIIAQQKLSGIVEVEAGAKQSAILCESRCQASASPKISDGIPKKRVLRRRDVSRPPPGRSRLMRRAFMFIRKP